MNEGEEASCQEINLTALSDFFAFYKASLYMADRNTVVLSVRKVYGSAKQDLFDSFIELIDNSVATPLKSLVLRLGLLEKMLEEPEKIRQEEFGKLKNIISSDIDQSLDAFGKIFDICFLHEQKPRLIKESICPIELVVEAMNRSRQLAAEKKQWLTLKSEEITRLDSLFGSHSWLVKALSECLAGAIESCRPESAIELYLEQVEGAVQLMIKGEGKNSFSFFSDPVYEPLKDINGSQIISYGAERKRPADKHQSSLNLGLSIAVRVINLHGGQIKLRKYDGQAVCCIEIPFRGERVNNHKIVSFFDYMDAHPGRNTGLTRNL
jgi:K+-sensing histidine kinase KdpD